MLVPRGRFPLQTGVFPPCAACRVRAELRPSLPHGLGSLVTVSGLGKVAVAGGAPSARFLPGSLRWGLAVSHARFGTVPAQFPCFLCSLLETKRSIYLCGYSTPPNETSDSCTSINTDIANMATTYLSNLIEVRNTAWNIVSEADKYGGDENGPHKCVSRFWTPEYYA